MGFVGTGRASHAHKCDSFAGIYVPPSGGRVTAENRDNSFRAEDHQFPHVWAEKFGSSVESVAREAS